MRRPVFLVAYATREGHTKKIADEIARVGREMGVDVDVVPIDGIRGPIPDLYAGIALGGSIHGGRFERELVRFVDEHRDELGALGGSFFGVCLTAALADDVARETVAGYVKQLVDETGWHPALMTMFGGALPYTQFGWLKRRLMKSAAKKGGLGDDTSRDYEYTDWHSVEAFAGDVIGLAVGGEVVPAQRPSARGTPGM